MNNFCETERKVADLCPRVVDEFNTLNGKSAKSKFSVIAVLKRTIKVIAEWTSNAYQYKPAVHFDITDLKLNSMYPGTESLQAVVLVNKKKSLRADLMRKDCSWGQGTTKMSYMKRLELNSLYKYSQRQRKYCRGNSYLPMKVLLSCSENNLNCCMRCIEVCISQEKPVILCNACPGRLLIAMYELGYESEATRLKSRCTHHSSQDHGRSREVVHPY